MQTISKNKLIKIFYWYIIAIMYTIIHVVGIAVVNVNLVVVVAASVAVYMINKCVKEIIKIKINNQKAKSKILTHTL